MYRPRLTELCVRLARLLANSCIGLTGGCAAFLAAAAPAHADTTYDTRSTYGEVGILDMPSAHMAPDGQVAITASALHGMQHYIATFQVLPWLEGSFRYSHTIRILGYPQYYDRSFGLKARLAEEDDTMPDISLGLRDILGTGVFSGEYLVASKHLKDFDFTFGLGWGRLAESGALPNPFGLIIPSFKTRTPTAVTGTVDVGEFFHGPDMGLFGGVVWRTPIDDLQVLVEYSSDRYRTEQSYKAFKVLSPVNVGLSYRPYDSIVLTAGWFYGSSAGVTLTFSTDPTRSNMPVKYGPELPAPAIRSPKEQMAALARLYSATAAVRGKGSWINVPDQSSEVHDLIAAVMSEGVGVRTAEPVDHTLLIDASQTGSPEAQCSRYAQIAANFSVPIRSIAVTDMDDTRGRVAFCAVRKINDTGRDNPGSDDGNIAGVRQKIAEAVRKQSIHVDSISIDGGVLWLYYSNELYFSETEAAGRIARVLMESAPSTVEVFHLISMKHGIAMRDFQITRTGLERAATASGTARELGNAIKLQAPPLNWPRIDDVGDAYPRFSWSIGPGVHEGFFDPDRPFQVQFLAAFDAEVRVTPKLSFDGRLEANIWNNFNFTRLSDSVLPHVRSDVQEYYQHGATGIAKLELNYRDRIAPDVFVNFKAGYLESMFAGAGGQILWRPDGERIAIGADVYEVWQREFNRLFGTRSYRVTTGHVSFYYASPWYGLNFNLHVGRYLAGDYGATIEMTRRFDTGVEIGAFATFTNVPFSKFGEGSFDKGIVLRIPFEWTLPFYSQSSYDLLLRSLTRDGGQRLDQDDSLYDETLSTSYGELERNLENIVAP